MGCGPADTGTISHREDDVERKTYDMAGPLRFVLEFLTLWSFFAVIMLYYVVLA